MNKQYKIQLARDLRFRKEVALEKISNNVTFTSLLTIYILS
ncbi:MAG: hypothetical protein ACI35P_05260 [Bacillus sp. (in: firmicutes)]